MNTTQTDKATARPWRFVIMSPSGAAKFLAKDEAEADYISKRLSNHGLKNDIYHFEQARNRDPHGVANLIALKADQSKKADGYRHDWIDGKSLIVYRGNCIAEAIWQPTAPNPKEAAAANGKLITRLLNAHEKNPQAANEYDALCKVAEAAKIVAGTHCDKGELVKALATLANIRQQNGGAK